MRNINEHNQPQEANQAPMPSSPDNTLEAESYDIVTATTTGITACWNVARSSRTPGASK